MKRIRHILPGFGYLPDNPDAAPISGIVAVAHRLALAATERGHDVSIVSFSNGMDRRSLDVSGISVHRLTPRPILAMPRVDLSYAGPLALFSLRAPVDLAHVHSNPYLLNLVRAKRKILHFHTPDFSDRPAYRRAVERADCILFCSSALRAQFVATVGQISRPLEVVHNGVDFDRFTDTHEAGICFRARLGIATEELVVMFAGQVTKVKGPHILVKTMEQVATHVDRPVRLVIIGNSMLWQKAGKPPVESEYERQLFRDANPSLVTFAGALPQSEMPGAYAGSDIFAFPSIWQEPFGITLLEAMASGRPVIASRVGGVPEIVHHGKNGLLVQPGSTQELAEAIARLAQDSAIRTTMGQIGQEFARQFDWNQVVDQIFELYSQLWGGR